MTVKKMRFIGLLQNVDSSILNVKLAHGFKFNSISKDEGLKLLTTLENLPLQHVHGKITEYHCLNFGLGKIFFVGNDCKITLTQDGASIGMSKLNNLVYSYLRPKIKLIRLFKEGDIDVPLTYYFTDEPNLPKSSERRLAHYSRGPMYHLNKGDIPKLQDLLNKTKMPFRDYIQLAFDSFEWSYEIHSENLAFLSLMNGLESLFNPGPGEIRYRLSRNCAVLLGKDKQEANEIFRNVRNLYDLRSSIVHGGKKIIVQDGQIHEVRRYLRESIKKLLDTNKPKEEVMKTLNQRGFGESFGSF